MGIIKETITLPNPRWLHSPELIFIKRKLTRALYKTMACATPPPTPSSRKKGKSRTGKKIKTPILNTRHDKIYILGWRELDKNLHRSYEAENAKRSNTTGTKTITFSSLALNGNKSAQWSRRSTKTIIDLGPTMGNDSNLGNTTMKRRWLKSYITGLTKFK